MKDISNRLKTETTRMDILSEEREQELGRRVLENDDKAREELVVIHLPFAKAVARKMWFRFNNRNKVDFDDMVQQANMGLMRATRDFDYREGRFSTYAFWWMKSTMQDALLESGLIRVPPHAQADLSKILRGSKDFVEEFKRPPTLKELSERIKLPESTTGNVLKFMNIRISSLDAPLSHEEDSGTVGEMIPSISNLSPEQVLMARDELRAAKRRVAGIVKRAERIGTPKQFNAFKVLYDIEGVGKRKTLEEAAVIVGTTRQNVEQLTAALWRQMGYKGRIGLGEDPISQEHERIENLESLLGAVDESGPNIG